jgi:CRISPR-associated endonuclease Csn1
MLPFSQSFDNSYNNKVLCFTKQNQEKGNKTPFETWGQTEQWSHIQTCAQKLPYKKRSILLTEKYDAEGWKSRHLNDTSFMAKRLREMLGFHLYGNNSAKHIFTVQGRLTSMLRGMWGFPDKDRTNDRHHGLDAIIVACTNETIVKRVAEFNKYVERSKDKHVRFPHPWDNFREDAQQAFDNIFVARRPRRKITGAAHEDTLRSFRKIDGEQKIIQRITLASLNLNKLETMVDIERNKKLYKVLKERLEAYSDDAKKAFAEPIYMPTNSGIQGPEIKGINIITTKKSGVILPKSGGAIASNGRMVRVDVFVKPHKNGKEEFYLCPIYAKDFAQKTLPNKLCVGGKYENDWPEADVSFTFRYSLHPNDYIEVTKSTGEVIEGYYNGMDRSTCVIDIKVHDNDQTKGSKGIHRGIGVKSLLSFKKYHVSTLGDNKTYVLKEKRRGMEKRGHSKSSKAKLSA